MPWPRIGAKTNNDILVHALRQEVLTEEQSGALYHQGEEAVVFALLEQVSLGRSAYRAVSC